MKRYYFFLLLIASSFFTGSVIAQQDPQFSQYMFNPLYANPAYAGSRGIMNGALEFRRQWAGWGDGAPVTEVFSINTPTKKGKVGLGMEVINDALGPKKSTGAYFDYAYRVPLGKGKLAFGLGAGLMSYRVDWNLVTYKDNADGYDQLGATSITKPDFKFGMYFNNKNFFAGASYTHLNREVYAFTVDTFRFTAQMSTHSYFTVGRAFQLSDNLLFSPSIMMRGVSGNFVGDGDLNLNFKFKDVLWLGVSLRSEKSVVAIVQYSITNHLKVGYSYDMTFSKLRNYQSGSHEIVLGFDLNLFQSQVLSPRYF